ncbi:tetratricopeptide repeat protein [Sphingomonas sp. CARO-RG-8B-R24-01]|uniref:tetratricopeptide repeat protein n=1 Tax=unclassified Sphingomonas TaxID=196159 RepID=UPI001F58EC34
MAVPPNTDAAFLREVDEELRRDQMATAWRRYGIAAIVVVVLIVLGFGGWQIYRAHQQSVAGDEGEALSKAYEDMGARRSGTDAELATLADSGVKGYRALALMSQADLLLQKNDLRGAAAKFAAIANDASIGQPFRDLALVRQTSAEFDTIKPDVVVSRLRGLAVKGNPWFGSAGEMVAVSYLKMGRRDLAGTLYGQIAREPDVAETVRQRAVQMAGVLGVDAVNEPKEQKSQ